MVQSCCLRRSALNLRELPTQQIFSPGLETDLHSLRTSHHGTHQYPVPMECLTVQPSEPCQSGPTELAMTHGTDSFGQIGSTIGPVTIAGLGRANPSSPTALRSSSESRLWLLQHWRCDGRSGASSGYRQSNAVIGLPRCSYPIMLVYTPDATNVLHRDHHQSALRPYIDGSTSFSDDATPGRVWATRLSNWKPVRRQTASSMP